MSERNDEEKAFSEVKSQEPLWKGIELHLNKALVKNHDVVCRESLKSRPGSCEQSLSSKFVFAS